MPSTGSYLNAAGDLLDTFGDAASNFARASMFGNNAEIDKINMGMSQMMTRVDMQRSEQRAMMIEGAQRAGYGAAGVAASGSALDVLRSTAQQASFDKALIQYKGGVNTLDWQLKYKSDKKAQHASIIGGALDVLKGGGIMAAAAFI